MEFESEAQRATYEKVADWTKDLYGDRTCYGKFGLDEDDAILYAHSLVGSSCDRNEFKLAILAVADRADDEIKSRWGGQRAMD